MAKQSTNRRPQSPKGRAFTRVSVKDKSGELIGMSKPRFDRNSFRSLAQAGRWAELEDMVY